MAKIGRPRALDEAKMSEVCALVTAGYGMAGAAEYVGCSASTIHRETIRNADFNQRLRRAILAAELEPLNSIRKLARENWRAAAWYLERTNAYKYARRKPGHVQIEDLQNFIGGLIAIIDSEVRNQKTKNRIIRRLGQTMGERTGDVDDSADFPADLCSPPPRYPKTRPKNTSRDNFADKNGEKSRSKET